MELARPAQMVVPSAHLPPSVMPVSFKPPTTETEHAHVLLELSSESLQTLSDCANNVFNTATSATMDLHAKYARLHSSSQLTTLVFAQRTTSSTLKASVFHARPVVRLVLPTAAVTSAAHHWSFKITTVLKSAVPDTSYQEPNVSDVQTTVSDVPQPTNVSTARIASISKEVPATLHAQLVPSLTKKPSNVLPATPHVRPVPTIQVHVPAANQEKDTCKLPELTKNVSRNVLKELSQKTESAKFATSDVPNVWVHQPTVLPAPPQDTCTTLLVGITAQVSLMQTESVSMNVHRDTSELPIKNASNAHQNARLAAATQLV